MTRKEFILFIASFDISCKKIYNLLEVYDQQDYNFSIVNYSDFIKIIGNTYIKTIQENANETYLEKIKSEITNNDIEFITREDDIYPTKLRRLSDAPYYLFCKGDLSLLNSVAVAVVGTRNPTNYGRIVTQRWSKNIALAGVSIISGLAYGVDSVAHRETLDNNGKTIAVLGGGLNKIYPQEHTSLANEIAKKGLLISEYSPNFSPTKYSFPNRNRIIAGLSDAVIITEAGMKSGSMITKDFAIDNGIPVFAIPGNISEKCEGTNNIIKSGQAICTTSPKDILDLLNLSVKTPTQKKYDFTGNEKIIIDLLKDGEKDVDYLCEHSGLDVNIINSLLVEFEIRDIIKRMAGDTYSLA